MPPDARAAYYYEADAKTMLQHRMAFALSRHNLQRFNVDTPDAFATLLRQLPSSYYSRLECIPWTTLAAQVTQQKSVVQEKDLSRIEAIVLATLRQHASGLAARLNLGSERNTRDRRIECGESKRGDSWTDGQNVIVISRYAIRRYGCAPHSWINYAAILVHELCHTTATLKRHAHGAAFYKRFHNAITYNQAWAISWFTSQCAADCPRIAERINQRMAMTELQAVDRHEAQVRRLAAIPAIGTAGVTVPDTAPART